MNLKPVQSHTAVMCKYNADPQASDLMLTLCKVFYDLMIEVITLLCVPKVFDFYCWYSTYDITLIFAC